MLVDCRDNITCTPYLIIGNYPLSILRRPWGTRYQRVPLRQFSGYVPICVVTSYLLCVQWEIHGKGAGEYLSTSGKRTLIGIGRSLTAPLLPRQRAYGWYTKLALTASGFRDRYPFHRLRLVATFKDFLSYSWPMRLKVRWQFIEAHVIDTRTAFVLGYPLQGRKQIDPVEYALHQWIADDRSVFYCSRFRLECLNSAA
jgi:hypothetical protein